MWRRVLNAPPSFRYLLIDYVVANALPQETIALPFGVEDRFGSVGASDDNGAVMSGVIIGTASDATTYVLTEGKTASTDKPLTGSCD